MFVYLSPLTIVDILAIRILKGVFFIRLKALSLSNAQIAEMEVFDVS